jgi:hypothetical protein
MVVVIQQMLILLQVDFLIKEGSIINKSIKTDLMKMTFQIGLNLLLNQMAASNILNQWYVLTNKRCLSSAELFVSAMETLPHVTIIGDTTGGGSGNPVFRELPNGWSMRLSTSYSALSDGFIYEGKGIPPDIPIWISTEDSINGRDVILERAIEFLNNK